MVNSAAATATATATATALQLPLPLHCNCHCNCHCHCTATALQLQLPLSLHCNYHCNCHCYYNCLCNCNCHLPVICMHTINFRKNCRSLLKYFLTCNGQPLQLPLSILPTCTSTHSVCWLARSFFNNVQPPSPFLARPNKYLYPTPVRSWFATCSMKL